MHHSELSLPNEYHESDNHIDLCIYACYFDQLSKSVRPQLTTALSELLLD